MNNSKNQPTISAIKSLLQLCTSSINEKPLPFQIKNWENVFDLAEQHRIEKVVSEVIKTQEISISTKLKERIGVTSKMRTLKMLAFSAEISSLCNQLNQQFITVIPLKGPIAAKQIYGDYTAKNSRDIDFLIRPDQLELTIQEIEKQGYACTYPYRTLSAKQKKAFQRVNNQLAFFHPKKKIQLEIHWRLFANPYLLPLTFNELISEGSQITVGKTSVPCLSNKHLLFYLCTHGAKHQWSLLYWLVEVATLVKKENFDWPTILQEAIQIGIERSLIQGILLIEILFKIPAPKCIQEEYQKNDTIKDIVQVSSQIIIEKRYDSSEKSIFNYWRMLSYKMKLRKDVNYKLAYLRVISVNDFELVKLPDALFFGYFWLRPFFWIWRYLIQPIKK